MEEESVSQCCQRMLRVMSAGGELGLFTESSTKLSTSNTSNIASTELSTQLSTMDEKLQTVLSEIDSRFTQIEERLGKLKA